MLLAQIKKEALTVTRRKAITTRLDIIQSAAKFFFKDGYSATSPRAIAEDLEISTGNLTYYFPTKEDLLAVFVEMLCNYQRVMMDIEAGEGVSSLLSVCLEQAIMAAMCEEDPAAKDFYLAAYTSPKCLEIIRRNDTARAKEVFREYCSGWDDVRFAEAETIVSGIEYATMMTTGDSAPLEKRIEAAVDNILTVYNVPAATRQIKIAKTLSMDYRKVSRIVLKRFKKFIDETNEKALDELLSPKA